MKPKRAYIICATPRSGTTLLTDLLSDCGIAGCPDSFFRVPSISWWADYLSVSTEAWQSDTAFDRAYLEAVLQQGSAGGEIFGMRLMQESLEHLCARLAHLFSVSVTDKELLQSVFGEITFVHLLREDKVAQAVSRLKAEQTGLWHVDADGLERERLAPAKKSQYDFELLQAQVQSYELQQLSWLDWFEREQIQPVRITYESLSSDPVEVVRMLLSALGLEPQVADKLSPRTAKLADAESVEWAKRFRAQCSKIKDGDKSN